MKNILLYKGWLNLKIDPSLDLIKEINYLKKKKNAVILAHYYQNADIQDIADYIGDSLGLAQEAQKRGISLNALVVQKLSRDYEIIAT